MSQKKYLGEPRKYLKYWTLIGGVVVGAAAVLLARAGNPPNMGICAGCFLRDTAGGLGLFAKPAVLQFLRPEIPGFILGAFAAALLFREFRSRSGSSPLLRFLIGAFVIVGIMVFLGCPIRLMVRLGSGDYATAAVGLLGLVAGVAAGCFCISRGFSLGRESEARTLSGLAAPFLAIGLTIFILYLEYGEAGDPAGFLETKFHAPILVALIVGLVVGFFGQRSRYCTAGGFRDVILWRDYRLFNGYFVLLATIAAGNLLLDALWPGERKLFDWGASPLAHSIQIWNFLGLFLTGLGSILIGGCPFRQIVAAGQGNADAALTLFGMMFGSAICHTFGIVAKPAGEAAAGGPTPAAKTAVIVGIVVLFVIGLVCTERKR